MTTQMFVMIALWCGFPTKNLSQKAVVTCRNEIIECIETHGTNVFDQCLRQMPYWGHNVNPG